METKRIFKFFTMFEYEKEQEFLRSMHRSGWKLAKISGICLYHFEKCIPEDVVYQLDYNQEGIAHRDEYVGMFRDCGGEYLQDYMGYSYFRKPPSQTAGSEEIFCDDDSRLQMLGRVYRGKLFPLAALFSCILIPQFVISLSRDSVLFTILFGMLIGLYLSIFAVSALQYWKLKKR